MSLMLDLDFYETLGINVRTFSIARSVLWKASIILAFQRTEREVLAGAVARRVHFLLRPSLTQPQPSVCFHTVEARKDIVNALKEKAVSIQCKDNEIFFTF